MKTEEELRILYNQYLYRFASLSDYNPERDGLTERDIANQLLGVAFAYGRMLGFGMSRIRLDAKKVRGHLEEKEYSGYKKYTL